MLLNYVIAKIELRDLDLFFVGEQFKTAPSGY